MFVTAGFIVGFDTEKASIGQAMIDFIEEANIPVCMVGLLYALPGTQLTRRLAKEGRLHKGHDLMKVEQAGDQCTLGCNFDTKRPLRDVLADYRAVLGHVFSPTAYAGRLLRLAVMLDRSNRRRDLPDGDMRKKLGGIDSVHRIMRTLPEVREPFWKTFVEVAKTNPGALRYIVMLMALYLHLGPFSKHVISEIDRRIADWGIRCNVIQPGLIETDLTAPMISNPLVKKMQSKAMNNTVLLRRSGKADEIAFTALFLASDESSYITGTD